MCLQSQIVKRCPPRTNKLFYRKISSEELVWKTENIG